MIKPKGIDKLEFELEAPIIVYPNGNDKTVFYSLIPEWLLARIRYERLVRKSSEKLATPSEVVVYLISALNSTTLEDDLQTILGYYSGNAIDNRIKSDYTSSDAGLSSNQKELALDLRKWIYSQQVEYLQ